MSECVRSETASSFRREDGRPRNPDKGYDYRRAWEEANGPLDRGLILHHTCHNPWCVNVEHLIAMTQSDHAKAHGRGGDWGQAAKTHCPAGHEYSETNTYTYTTKDGSVERYCKTCRLATKRRYNERKRLVK